MSVDQIVIKGMQFYGYHGVLKEEQLIGQRFIVNLTLHLRLSDAGQSDDVNDTINYADVFARTKTIVEGKRVQLLEHLAERLASHMLDTYERLLAVDVEVEKPGAPIPGVFDVVKVCIHRARKISEDDEQKHGYK